MYLKFRDAVGVYQPQLKRLLEYSSIKERYGGPDCKGILERLWVQGSCSAADMGTSSGVAATLGRLYGSLRTT